VTRTADHSELVAIVLAGGDSSRLGTPKQLQSAGTDTLLRHTLRTALDSGADTTIVVLGAHAERLAEHIRDLPVQLVRNPEWASGLSSSLRAGVNAAPKTAAAALLLVADQPAISATLLRAIIERWRAAPDAPVACAYGGTVGVPALLPRALFDELRDLRGDTGAKPVLVRHRERLLTVEFPDGTLDVDQHPPRAVIFDFGNVISTFDVRRFIQNLVTVTGKSADELKAAIGASMPLIYDFETGLVSPEEFIAGMNRAAGVALSAEEFQRAYCEIFTPIPETIALIRALKGRFRLGLLSNTNAVHFDCAIRPVEVFALFDAVTLSFEVKAMKPARAIYDDMLHKLKLRAEECVFIDDLRDNVEAATRLGFRAIHYTSHQQLLEDLRRAGVHTDEASPSSGETP
jgi:epoxide hydrolase-like predicted phosphatase